MLHGLPGTGKSWLAEKIGEHLPNSKVLKTISFRKTAESSPNRFDETNPVVRKEKDESYKAMLEEARNILESGKIPILDATFHQKNRRDWAYTFVEEIEAKVAMLSIICDEETALKRIEQRQNNTEDEFLDSKEAYLIMKKQSDELSNERIPIKIINTEKTNINEVIQWLKNTLS